MNNTLKSFEHISTILGKLYPDIKLIFKLFQSGVIHTIKCGNISDDEVINNKVDVIYSNTDLITPMGHDEIIDSFIILISGVIAQNNTEKQQVIYKSIIDKYLEITNNDIIIKNTALEKTIDELENQLYQLLKIIDDIDTVGDFCKGDIVCYKNNIEKLQKTRWDVLDEAYVDKLYNKYYPKEKNEIKN